VVISRLTMMRLRRRIQPIMAVLAILTVLAFATDANSRAGGGSSLGSRGMRTFTPPATTPTAPNSASPIQRSITQPGQSSRTASPSTGFFNRPGLMGGLFGGLLGAGLFGLLFGYGLFGGLGGFASVLGLVLQVVLVVVAARLIWNWWQRRQAPAYAGASMLRGMTPNETRPNAAGGSAGSRANTQDVQIGPEDYDTFERLLGEIQLAFGAEDLASLRSKVTPEMLSYFAEELAQNASRGVVNRLTDPKLLKGDLAESWREGPLAYATLAMRFSVVDATIDRATGRVVEGDPSRAIEVTELWTFMRAAGGSWLLSAIQQG